MSRGFRLIGAVVLALAVVASACGSGTGSPEHPAGESLVAAVRNAETLVVGFVFTQFMRDVEVVDAALALCAMRSEHGDAAALELGTEMLRDLDWRAPANSAMLGRILMASDPAFCSQSAVGDVGLDQILPPRPQSGGGGSAAAVDASVAALLETSEGVQFIGTIRELEAETPSVFTRDMSDTDLVRLGMGICATQSQLGPAATDELRLHQESYGWTSDADDAMFDLLVEAAAAVCIIEGS